MSTKARIKIGTLRDDAMLFWGVVKMMLFIMGALCVVAFWTAFITTVFLRTLTIVYGYQAVSVSAGLSDYIGSVSGIFGAMAIFILAPIVVARGYLYIPRTEVLDQIHFESLKPSTGYDFSEEGKPDEDDAWEHDESFQARALR